MEITDKELLVKLDINLVFVADHLQSTMRFVEDKLMEVADGLGLFHLEEDLNMNGKLAPSTSKKSEGRSNDIDDVIWSIALIKKEPDLLDEITDIRFFRRTSEIDHPLVGVLIAFFSHLFGHVDAGVSDDDPLLDVEPRDLHDVGALLEEQIGGCC